MRGMCAIVAAVGLGAASAAFASERLTGSADPAQTVMAQADAPGGPNRPDDAATTTGERVDPNKVRAAGGSKITPENAAQIANLLLSTAPPRDVTISAAVGAPLPGDIDVQPLPPSVTDLVPEYRGFVYATANDKVVIVKPATRRVVEVISAGGGRP